VPERTATTPDSAVERVSDHQVARTVRPDPGWLAELRAQKEPAEEPG
jgi:hypothetical protein